MLNFKLINLRRIVAGVLLLTTVVMPLRGAEGGTSDGRDEGGGGFRIEVPVPDKKETERPRAERQDSLFFVGGGTGQGWMVVNVDTFPLEVFVDGKKMVVTDKEELITLLPGRHYVSLFPVRDVFLAYRDETPEWFWRMLSPDGLPADRFALLASYEREAVRAGTRWVQIEPDDTSAVHLSPSEVSQVYRRQGSGVAITFFSIATLIAAAMVGSVALLMGD